MNFSASVQGRLQQAFSNNNMVLDLRPDHIVVTKSQDSSRDKIQTIVESAGFCAILSNNKIDDMFAFTVVPYVIPEWFKLNPLNNQGNHNPIIAQPGSITRASANNVPNFHLRDPLLIQKPLLQIVNSFYKKANINLVNLASEYSQNYNEHFERNKRNILSLAENLRGEALILGLGNGHDIPLQELANQFDQITALDIDMHAMRKAIQQLPVPSQKKFILIQKDLTDHLSLISEKIQLLLTSHIPEKICLEKTADIIDESLQANHRPLFSSTKKYDFVISSMLTGQLFSQTFDFIMNTLEKKYPHIKEHQQSCQKLQASVQKFGNHLCKEHLDHFLEWTRSDGKIYYADNTHLTYDQIDMYEYLRNPNQLVLNKGVPNETLPNNTINAAINTNFHSLRNIDSWLWQGRPPMVKFDPPNLYPVSGMIMTVVARFLQPKAIVEEKK